VLIILRLSEAGDLAMKKPTDSQNEIRDSLTGTQKKYGGIGNSAKRSKRSRKRRAGVFEALWGELEDIPQCQ
jgi:hypothetical protein